MACADCKHKDHEAGECARCNCGESEVVRLSSFYYFRPVDYGENVHLWAERLSHKIRPYTRTRIVPY